MHSRHLEDDGSRLEGVLDLKEKDEDEDADEDDGCENGQKPPCSMFTNSVYLVLNSRDYLSLHLTY